MKASKLYSIIKEEIIKVVKENSNQQINIEDALTDVSLTVPELLKNPNWRNEKVVFLHEALKICENVLSQTTDFYDTGTHEKQEKDLDADFDAYHDGETDRHGRKI